MYKSDDDFEITKEKLLFGPRMLKLSKYVTLLEIFVTFIKDNILDGFKDIINA